MRRRACSWPSCRRRCRHACRRPAGRRPARPDPAAFPAWARASRCSSEYTGTLRRASRSCGDSIMLSWRFERKPCCGPKSAESVTPLSSRRRSAVCWNRASIDAGLQTRPTRRPSTRARSVSSSRSMPSVTSVFNSRRSTIASGMGGIIDPRSRGGPQPPAARRWLSRAARRRNCSIDTGAACPDRG